MSWDMILAVAVVGLFIWSVRCCRKAREAHKAAEILWEWVKIVHGPVICAVEKHPECKDAGPGWPPGDIGNFPPSV